MCLFNNRVLISVSNWERIWTLQICLFTLYPFSCIVLLFMAGNFFNICINDVKPQSESKFFEVGDITFIYLYGISIHLNVLYGIIIKTKCVCSLEWREKIASFLYSVQFKNTDKKNQCNFGYYQLNLVFAAAQFWEDCNWVYSEFYQCL